MKQYLSILAPFLLCFSCGEKGHPELLEELMKSANGFEHILRNRDALEVQILYTQIDRDENNLPSFRSYSFNLDSTRYFYPASTVKLPLVLLSLEKLRELDTEGLDRNTVMLHDSVYRGQLPARKDTTSEAGMPSVGHYAKKILIVSDNDAFNRLYEFAGQKKTNERLRELGYNARIIHRLERPLSRDENAHTEAVRFIKDNSVIYQQPMLVNEKMENYTDKILRGKAFIRNDSLINEPFDFTYKNFFSLSSQQRMLRSIIFPETVKEEQRFRLTEEDRRFVMQYLSQLPDETLFPPCYADTAYYDAYCKFLMFGTSREPIPPDLRIFNKVGDAYGYLIDNAYIVDFSNGVEFMLSAVINTNTDSIYNDGKYEYESLGYPFMRDLGQLIYKHELNRERKYKPDLSEFRFQYDK